MALEAALADGEDVWARFAAWLKDQGSPRGDAALRELALGAVDHDDATLRTLYSAIHRCSAAAQLAREKSWQFEWRRGFPIRAAFLLADTRSRGARAYVHHRWERKQVDPEITDAERVQLEHGLGLMELRFLTDLEFELSEFAPHLPLVARLLAAHPWDHLTRLRLAVAHYEPGWMGADEAREKALVTGAETRTMLAALPKLRRLELAGHFFFPALAHPKLTELRLVGHMPVLNGGFQSRRMRDDRGLTLPNLRRLELAAMNPSGGGGPPMDACRIRLDKARLPALTHLELQDSDLGDVSERGGVFETIARSPILPQLKTLHLRSIDIHCEAPEPILRKLAPRFAHLERFIVDEATAEQAEQFTAGNFVRAGHEPRG
jgi:hypothetical protein